MINLKVKNPKNPLLIALALGSLGVIVSAGLLILLHQKDPSADAASTSGFEAGNIMSDAVMANKSTMTQKQIQNFLDGKNRCKTNPQNPTVLDSISKDKTDGTYKYGGKTYKYHLNNGKFICLADQKFDGETAAQIIYRAAQDYSINPQVFLVLLEKEQGLISDNWPNYNHQYAAAVGYDCPDTPEGCNSANAGFKTQIRKAAGLFREVLDGGWSTYPVGKRYVQYNPSTSCGGSTVNIQNRATSALYRYTPYQPNKAALAAGYGSAPPCGAYGNRNFYLLFTDWFGSTQKKLFTSLDEPRWMRLSSSLRKTNIVSRTNVDGILDNETQLFFPTKTNYPGQWYLRSRYDTQNGYLKGIPLAELDEIPYTAADEPRWMELNHDSKKYDPRTEKPKKLYSKGLQVKIVSKIQVNGQYFLRTAYDTELSNSEAFQASRFSEIKSEPANNPRWMTTTQATRYSDPLTESVGESIQRGTDIKVSQKINVNDKWYLIDDNCLLKDFTSCAIPATHTTEIIYTPADKPREMELKNDIPKVDPRTGKTFKQYTQGLQVEIVSKIRVNNNWYFRTAYDTSRDNSEAFPASQMKEISKNET